MFELLTLKSQGKKDLEKILKKVVEGSEVPHSSTFKSIASLSGSRYYGRNYSILLGSTL
jgi:hypothetical protein